MRIVLTSLTAAACLLLAYTATGSEWDDAGCGAPDRCADCGCRRPCQEKVCQVVCETENVKKVCWAGECEEFCSPLPACGSLGSFLGSCTDLLGGRCRDSDCCAECDSGCESGCCDKCPVPPKCGPVRYRKKLLMKEYKCEVPVYRCVVKYVCSDCDDGGCDADQGAPEAEIGDGAY